VLVVVAICPVCSIIMVTVALGLDLCILWRKIEQAKAQDDEDTSEVQGIESRFKRLALEMS
jgi:hypothetical protein